MYILSFITLNKATKQFNMKILCLIADKNVLVTDDAQLTQIEVVAIDYCQHKLFAEKYKPDKLQGMGICMAIGQFITYTILLAQHKLSTFSSIIPHTNTKGLDKKAC